jgi:WD40 repeat protein
MSPNQPPSRPDRFLTGDVTTDPAAQAAAPPPPDLPWPSLGRFQIRRELGHEQEIKVWDAATGKEALTLRRHTDEVNSVAWARDGIRLASGATDRTIRIYDATIGYAVERARR